MAWHLSDTSTKHPIGHVQFLLDENLSPNMTQTLRDHGYDAIEVPANGLYDRQILLTQNRELFDDNTRSASVVFLPDVIDVALLGAVARGLSVLWNNPKSNERLKVAVHNDGRITVRGAQQTTHYKLRRTGPPLIWIPKRKLGSSELLNPVIP
jgi:hypothetical protein